MTEFTADIMPTSSKNSDLENKSYDAAFIGKLSNDDVVRHLAPRIRDKIHDYYPDLADSNVIVKGKAWGGQETARTFRFEIISNDSHAKRVFFVKLCPIFERINPSLTEYETLQLLHERMPLVQKNCHVSRPIDFYPELNAYAMESVGTKDFRSYLLRNNSWLRRDGSLTDLFSVVEGCGDWLRTFHEITRSKKSLRFNSNVFIKNMNADFDYNFLRKFAFKKETLSALDALLERLTSLDNKYDMPCAKWHWDYTPGHVYLDKERISVIDILGIDDIPVYEDIGRFLAAMATVNNLPLYPLFDHQRADTVFCDIFLSSYARDARYDKDKLLLFASIYKLKYLIIGFSGQHFRVSSKLHPIAGKVYANLRLVKLFEPALLRNARVIVKMLDRCT